MRVANYYRVSTKLQEDRYSLAAQKTELTSYAATQGWNIVNEFTDVDSGGKLDKPGLNALIDCAEEGKIDVVLVINQDRLSRLDTIAWEFLKGTLRDNNVKIAEPGMIVDLADEDQEFFSDLKNLIAKREKRSIVKKMMYGKRQRMREGKGWGKPPFEYYFDKKSGEYKLEEKWSWVIPFIDDLYLNKQYGMKMIMDELNKLSLTPTGRKWNEHLIHTRLSTKAYHGVMEKTYSNGETISVENLYPSLRTEETWEKLQIERAKRRDQFKANGRSRDDLHILRRTNITCGECGRKILLSQHGEKDKPRYYLKHGRQLRVKDQSVCDITINSVRFDDNIIKAIKEILASENLAKKYMNLDFDSKEVEQLSKIVRNNENKISDLKHKIDKLIDLYLDSPNMSKATLGEKQSSLENELKIVTEQNKALKSKLDIIKNHTLNYEYVYELMEVAHGFDTDLTPLERAQVMSHLFPTGILFRDKLILQANINGVPLDIKIPIGESPYTNRYKNKVQ
jgi:site-specific DNA recombinase